jgi:leucyl aminopeptidase
LTSRHSREEKVDIQVIGGNIKDIKADAIIVSLLEWEATDKPLTGAVGAVDEALSGTFKALLDSGDLKGKLNQTAVLYPRGAMQASRVIVVGLGKPQDVTLDKVRQAAGTGAKKAGELACKSIAAVAIGAGGGGLDPRAAAQATVEGMVLALYEFRVHKSTPAEHGAIESVTLAESDAGKLPAVQEGARVGRILADATNFARDLVNQPSNHMTPHIMADAARDMAARNHLICEVLNIEQMAELGMGALMGVTRGSDEPPAFIILEYKPDAGQPVIFVGKGITFDSGGISLKPGEGMGAMKGDMAGAAAVIGAMQAVAQLDLPLHVVALAPACENLPSGHAYKPGDVLKAMNGKTIEIISTDAEGRLILADALCYADRYKPSAVVDLATLTGSCVVALGENVAAGIFSNDDDLSAKLREAGAKAGEKLWPLPLYEEYRDKIKSEVADMKNSGGRTGGVGTSAIFLKEFASYSWAHLDIAPVESDDKGGPYQPKGATGFGVRTLVEFLRGRIG